MSRDATKYQSNYQRHTKAAGKKRVILHQKKEGDPSAHANE